MDMLEAPSFTENPITFAGDSPQEDQNAAVKFHELQAQNESLLFELDGLRSSYQSLEAKYNDAEEILFNTRKDMGQTQQQNAELLKIIEELKSEIEVCEKKNLDVLRTIDDWMIEKEGLEREIYEGMREREELVRRIDVGVGEREELMKEIEVYRKKGMESEDCKRVKDEGLLRSLERISSIKESIIRVVEGLDEEVENATEEGEESMSFFSSYESIDGLKGSNALEVGLDVVLRMVERVETKLTDYQEKQKEALMKETEAYKKKIMDLEDKKKERGEDVARGLGRISNIKETLFRVIGSLDEEKMENDAQENEELDEKPELLKELECLSTELDVVLRMVKRVEAKLNDHQEKMKEKKKEMEEETREREKGLVKNLESLSAIKESMLRVIESLDVEKVENGVEKSEGLNETSEELDSFSMGFDIVLRIAKRVEEQLNDYQVKMKKEKRELENSVVSLTEENRDINSLLRIALVEKEAVEKSLNKLKGSNEQKRVALLQIAERGLQRVGFGFMMGAAPTEQPAENTSSNASNVSDSSECEEEVVSLASTVEKIMKNLRLEITQLRRALEESRSDIERLQSLTEKQAQEIAAQTLYIKELEDRETLLTQNVEELLMEIKATEEEVARWREACELEAEAGKTVVEERDKVTAILKQELEKTRAALEISNSKLKLKEELAAAAMAAQEAAERSLQLADSRAAGLRTRIEELNTQLEEAERREKNSRRGIRHICWPWGALKVNPASGATPRVRNARRLLPEMQALLH
ncbi:hypothetical protein Ancab_009213 [Ancistrocladus abbreviatus]